VMAFLTVRKLALVAPKTYLDTAIRVCTGAAAVMPSFFYGKAHMRQACKVAIEEVNSYNCLQRA
jgi:hypothetical protein